MEGDRHDNTAAGGGRGGGGSDTRPLILHDEEDSSQESAAKFMEPVNDLDEDVQPCENNEEGPGTEARLQKSDTKVLPELTLVVIGDLNAIDIGSNNLLLDNDEQGKVSEFSHQLYDLCGRRISVVNMLGLQNIEFFQLNDGIDAFLLLIPNGLHVSHYSSGLEWLEKTFGKESFAFLMTVVTHKSDEKCENALADLKANGFDEKRYHTCLRSMTDIGKIIELLEKIDVMVSENNHCCYGGAIHDVDKEEKSDSLKEERTDSSPLQQNHSGSPAAWWWWLFLRLAWYLAAPWWLAALFGDEPEKSNTQNEQCEDSSDVEHSGNTDSSMESGHKPDSTEKGDEPEKSCPQSEQKCDDSSDVEHSVKTDSSVATGHKPDSTEKGDEPETSSTQTEQKCDECGDVEHSGQTDSSGATSQKPDSTDEGTTDMNDNGNKDDFLKPSQDSIMDQDHGKFETLLCRLQLKDKYQQKWTPDDFLKILLPVRQSQDTCEKDLAQTFLQRLMLLDYRARYILTKQDCPDDTQTNPAQELDNNETQEDDLDLLYDTVVDSDESKPSHVYPMDVQMAVFHCSDSFLRQSMITKLSQCQFALPLLVPDPVTERIECPLWTFRQIKKTWKTTQTTDNSDVVTMKSMPICKAETPMVSFFRLGTLSLSKSQLINALINDRHSTFFHRECPGSTESRHLMEGVAEIAWYYPVGKPDDAFSDCTAFCNLHGDAMLVEKQREILTEKSSVIVVFVPTLKKGDQSSSVISALFKSQKPLIFLIDDENCNAVQIKKGKYKMGLKGRNQAAISEELKGIIRSILSEPHATFSLETMAAVSGIRVDEDDKICREAKSAAMKIEDLLKGKDVSVIKETFLSCQGELWHKWCNTNKELYHLVGQIEMQKSKKKQEMTRIRQQQCKGSDSELMTRFIKSLSSFQSKDKEYFLKWTQILIDALPNNDLTPILQRYDKKWTEILTLKKDQKNTDQQEKELDQMSKELQSATFGLEHIFREMGQIYEAHASLKKRPMRGVKDWSKYPELAAELMISGHPMELMDGDAGHVPLTWISSLLGEVIKKLGDKRVFVLSVLGVQSSGKSTMLNAMFGLEFAVSAGRCTKGAFMQLLKVSEEERHFKFDYILVVDTEGLRALELAGNVTLNHDNELATFVVGLGNMTLINIFGENPADMQDVLQIVVQAFMRMKRVNLSPSCVFVHQNVTDISAAEKNMEGKRRLQEKLDQMAQLAAKEEVCGAGCFSDIITFNVQEDVKYFAQLWEGSPPMAPPNPGYSKSIQELKNFILSKASQSTGIALSHFSSKVQDLWSALLNENFVFSFKNTLEIAVYRKLEVKYGDLTWTLRNTMLNIENQFYTRIKNGQLESVELNDLYKETNKTFSEIQRDLTSYFEDNRDKEILAQWRGRFESKIKDFHEEQVKILKNKLDKVLQQKKACKKLDEERTEFENKLMQKSEELAQKLKGKADDEKKLKKQFDSVWSLWVRELTRGTNPVDDINLENEKTCILLELGIEWSLIDESKRSGKFKKMSEIGNYFQYVCTKHQDEKGFIQRQWHNATGKVSNFIKSFSYNEQDSIRSFINEVEKKSLNTLESKPVATTGYNPAYLQEVAINVKEEVTKFESKQKYALKKEFTVDLVHYVFDRAESWLLDAHKQFKANNDAKTYVESKKTHYYNIFKMFCKGSSSVMVLGASICEKLKASMVEAVCNNTAINLANEMKCSSPVFSGNRNNLENYVLKSLAEKEDFDSFITYIKRPRKHVESFIKEEVKKYIFQENKDKAQQILKKNVDDIYRIVNQALYDTTEKVKTQSGDTDMWLEEFSSLLKDKLAFTISCQSFNDIRNFDFLKDEITKGLKSITEEIDRLPLDEMKNYRMKPDEILIDQLCNCCWVTCPFCSAVCSNTLEDHSPEDHSVTFHRSSAVKGRHYRGTDEMSLEFCTSKVTSNISFYLDKDSDVSVPYKLYRTAGPKYENWRITPDESRLSYWKWFVCRFQKELEDHYELKLQGRGEIPSEWRSHTKEQAIASLDWELKPVS